MDSNHKLDAPNNESLKNIEQVQDHSELSTMYRKAHDQWEGELVSDTERETRRQSQQDTISFGIRPYFAVIGFLVPLPIILAAISAIAILSFSTEQSIPMQVIPSIFGFMLWVGITYLSYKKLRKLFYKNALSALPYTIVLLTLLALSVPIFYLLTEPLHSDNFFVASILISAITILWSVVLSLPLLRLWTTPKLSGNAKFGIITLLGLAIAAGAAATVLI